MSRLAALKEYTFMKALWENGFPVPEPVAQNRHTIVMELIDAFPLRQIVEVPDPAGLYSELIDLILRLAGVGLIHGDFNEFNILIRESKETQSKTESRTLERSDSATKIEIIKKDFQSAEKTSPNPTSITLTPIIIDFPQMISIDHGDAVFYFDRDVNCIKRFFERRFHFTSDAAGPFFSEARNLIGKKGAKRLDVEVEASGFSKKMTKELEAYMREVGVDRDGDRLFDDKNDVRSSDSEGDSGKEQDRLDGTK